MKVSIWNNGNIQVSGGPEIKKPKTLNWFKLYQAGISKIKDEIDLVRLTRHELDYQRPRKP